MNKSPNKFAEITGKLTDLPTLPTVVTKITELMQNPRTSASELGQAITTDQSLTSKTLKLVNSAFYGFPGRINTITHAIVILGFSTVKNIVLTASIFSAISSKGKNQEGFDVESFWRHSISTGAIAKVLSEMMYQSMREEAFIGGLLHDLGKVVLAHYAKEDYSEVLKLTKEPGVLIKDAEKKILTFTHSEVGIWVAEKWNLPKDLKSMIEFHHYPVSGGTYDKMASVIHVSDIISRAFGYHGGDDSIPVVSEYAWKKLEMDNLNWKVFLKRCEEEIDKASVFLEEI